MANMKRALLRWIPVLTVSASFIIINALSNSSPVAAENYERADRKLADIDYSDVISIDCGVNEDYTDETTGIKYQADTMFVQSGQIYNVSSYFNFARIPQIGEQLNSLRSFPDGKRNCYTLKPKQAKNKKYLARAYLAYGNYDLLDRPPIFNIHLGVNYWTTLEIKRANLFHLREAIHITSRTIDFCFINTGQGAPFISILELWPLDSSLYQTTSTLLPLGLGTRSKLAMSRKDASYLRYTDDIYGRSWFNDSIKDSWPIKAPAVMFDSDKLGDYKLPIEVLSTAVRALNSSGSLNITPGYSTSYEYYVYLHFFDFEERANNRTRKMDITFNDNDALTQHLSLRYWEPHTMVQNIKIGEGIDIISIKSSSDSDLPAMLNAYEIYYAIPQPNSATQRGDVDAIRDIKGKYNISRINWQGDPCGPDSFTWEGLNCSGGDNPRIILLNLSSSKLAGDIIVSFSNLTDLEILDLSNNELTGEVPEFFAELPNLKILNLTGNKLTGSIPEALKAKLNNPLQLSLDGNPGLCEIGLCKSNSQKKSIVPLAASIAASVAVLIVVVTVSMMVWRLKRKNERVMSQRSKKDEQLKSKSQAFPYSEVLSITNDFETQIGKGGFGNVYLGVLQDGRRVAVKLLSLSSKQGYKEFQSEAKFLMLVHHRNLVSLVGYCDEGDIKALIYEYMSKGNLQQQLSGLLSHAHQ